MYCMNGLDETDLTNFNKLARCEQIQQNQLTRSISVQLNLAI